MSTKKREKAVPTGAEGSAKKDGKKPASADRARPLSAPGSGSKGKRMSFGGGTSKRDLQLELLGENTPGPGSYLPASTFAKAYNSSSSSPKKGKKPPPVTTSAFRSTSPQRVKARNSDTPGPGAHSPNKAATERNLTNSAPSLVAKGKRFGVDSAFGVSELPGAANAGPGEYDTHKYQTMATDTAHAVAMGSKQNPGFGIASPQHQLPHEQPIDNDRELPGPGKYNTNVSELSGKGGHTSVFKQPTERKKVPVNEPPQGGGGRASPKGGKKGGGVSGGKVKGGKAAADTVHV